MNRFDENGIWQPRCSALFAFFTKLRSERPGSVYVFSAGLLFHLECEHYVPELRLLQTTKELIDQCHKNQSYWHLLHDSNVSPLRRCKTILFFVEDLGFHVSGDNNGLFDGSSKGKALEGVLNF